MSLSINGGRAFADVSILNVNGTSGIGVQGLGFALKFHIYAWPANHVWLKNCTARVSVAGKGHLGVAAAEPTLVIRNFEHSSDSQVYLSMNLSREQLEELEQIRNGGGFKFTLALSLEVFGPSEPCYAIEQINVDVNQSGWLSVLKDMRYTEVLLYEVKQPLNSNLLSEEYKELHASLRSAQEHYAAGQYTDAVAHCRIALDKLELLHDYRKDTKSAVTQYCSSAQDRMRMDKDQRALIIKEALRNYTHLTHHADDNGKTPTLSRAEAGMILGCTFAVIGQAANKF